MERWDRAGYSVGLTVAHAAPASYQPAVSSGTLSDAFGASSQDDLPVSDQGTFAAPSERKGDDPKWTDKAIVFLTFGLLIVGIGQGYIYWRQAKVMREALNETVKSNESAKKSADAAKQSAETALAAERAYLFIHLEKMLFADGDFYFTYSFANGGRTPAIVKSLYLNFRAAAPPLLEEPNYPNEAERLHHTEAVIGGNFTPIGVGIKTSAQLPVIYGYIEYLDIMRSKHTSRFCMRFQGSQYETVGGPEWNEWD